MLKVPKNFDTPRLCGAVRAAVTPHTNLNKMQLLILDYRGVAAPAAAAAAAGAETEAVAEAAVVLAAADQGGGARAVVVAVRVAPPGSPRTT